MEIPEGKKYYQCVTQEGLQQTIGEPPQENSSLDDGQDGLVVGLGFMILRWIASTSNPTNLSADEWNAIGFGVKISQTSDQALANFIVRYYKPPREEGFLASAFFPNEVEDVLVYHKTLVEPTWKASLKNTFLHEIRHIIGLRHEFSIKKDRFDNGPEGDEAKQFGSENLNSVMSYEDINNIQETHKHDVKEFYKLPNNYKIDGVKIWDYVPKPLKQ